MLPNYLPLIGDRDHEEGAGRVKVKGLASRHGRPEVHGFSVYSRYFVQGPAERHTVTGRGVWSLASSSLLLSIRVAEPFGIVKGAPQPLRKTVSSTVGGASARQAG